MSIAQKRKEDYLKEKENKDNGFLNGIPLYYTFPKLGKIIPSIPKGYPILMTANSGIGKTNTWIGIFLYTSYKLKKDHPELNLKIKLVIALLEDTKEMFIDRLYSMLFFELYQIRVDTHELHSMREKSLDLELIKKLDSVQKEIDFIDKNSIPEYVECLDYVDGQFTKGKIYLINKDRDNSYTVYFVTLDDSGSTTNGWGKSKFKPSTKEAYDLQNKSDNAPISTWF